ncbi:beta-lactamase family protein [Anaerovorax odorimutans]|uniref:Beta-lactamase family protein n=1 Tax=Anaerovorax odorimutans TaxID=109327 RepID=A0ABT1RQT5_9FIRM|nr:serine hydrolase domain-containing protein [Anaerovorax odorimutans]MCQ4637560.1 beta-lactamase family protein [Anaerovorax odorimutans]
MENIIKQLDGYAEEALFYHDLPGLAISVEVGEKGPAHLRGLNYKKALGVKDVTTKEPLMPEHIFHMASVSKLFTSAGILQLCEKGKLSLTDRLADLLPYVSIADERYGEIQLIHMLTHTSGMGDVEDYHWDEPQTDELALKNYALSGEVKDSHMLWSPAENKFRYSNIAYELLGLIISEVSGRSYEQYMKEFILDPLEMDDSTFLTFERADGSLDLKDLSRAGMAMPHTKDKEKHIILENYYPYNRQHGPSSTLTSNVFDLAKWAKAHLERKFFKEKTYEEIWKKRATVPNNGEGMGLGWFMRRQGEYDIYGHEGTDDGFRASFWICPALCAHVTVVSNISRGAVKKINKKIFEILIRSV